MSEEQENNDGTGGNQESVTISFTPAEWAELGIDKPEGLVNALRASREEKHTLAAEVKTLRDAAEQARIAGLSEAEQKIEQARAEGRAEAQKEIDAATADLALVSAKAKAVGLAGSVFHDPALVVDLAGITGDMDDTAIKAALDAVAKDRPFLVAKATPRIPLGPRSSSDSNDMAVADPLRAALTGARD